MQRIYIKTDPSFVEGEAPFRNTYIYRREKIMIMDLEENEDSNNCAGEGQQQFNRPTDSWLSQLKVAIVKSGKPGTVRESRGRGMSAVEAGTKQRLVEAENTSSLE
jgi:hypothetical protein